MSESYRMFVKSINAKCDSEEATLTRTMSLVDLESTGPNVWSTQVSMTMPAMNGVGTGDLLYLTVEHGVTAAVYEDVMKHELEIKRDAAREKNRAERELELREDEARDNEIRNQIEADIRAELTKDDDDDDN